MKLYMTLLGCKPQGRHTEQHDVFFGVGRSLKELVPSIIDFWPEANGKIHVDAWREVTKVDNYKIALIANNEFIKENDLKLFFINLGGYKPNEFDEFHYKVLTVASSKAEAIQKAKETSFYKHTQFDSAVSHIDDKYGIDVDDLLEIDDILSEEIKKNYSITITPATTETEDSLQLGYFKLSVIAGIEN